MLLNLLVFELVYHSRQIGFRFAAGAYLLLGMVCSTATIGGPQVLANSPYTLVFIFIALSLGTPIIVALFAGNAILRDGETRMAPIVFSTNVSHFQYLLSRFCGLVLAAFLAVLPAVIGLLMGYAMPDRDASQLGAFSPGVILWALFIVVLPNILLGAACVFTTAALTRSTLATYLSGVFLYALYSIASMVGSAPLVVESGHTSARKTELATLVEPYGLIGFFEITRYWTAEEKNNQVLPLEGPFLLNRLLWMGLSLLMFAFTYRFFHFRTISAKSKRRIEAPVNTSPFKPREPGRFFVQPRLFGSRGFALVSAISLSLRSSFFGWPCFLMMFLWTFFLWMTLGDSLNISNMGVPNVPTTAVLLAAVYDQWLFVGPMFLIFYTGELLWQEARVGMDAIVDSSPMPDVIFFASKWLSMCILVSLFLGLSTFLILAFQVLHQSLDFQFGPLVLFALQGGGSLLFLGTLAIFLMSFVKHKYGSMLVTFFLVALFTPYLIPNTLGLEHPMLRFGDTPPFLLSSMTQEHFHRSASYWYLGYWLAVSGFLALFTLARWRRGSRSSGWGWGSGGTAVVVFLTALFMACGGVIFYHTNIDQRYHSKASLLDWRERYEHQYAEYRSLQQPTVTDIKLAVDLFPDQRSYKVSAELQLVNHSGKPIDRLLIGLSEDVVDHELHLKGATLQWRDQEYGHFLFQFDDPFLPEQQRFLMFTGDVDLSSFKTLDPEHFLTGKSGYLEVEKSLPGFGFREERQIKSSHQRKKRGLPPLATLPAQSDAGSLRRDRLTFELLVSTKPGQTVIGPGRLLRDWQTKNRHYFEFASMRPVPMALNIATSEYKTMKTKFKDIEVIYYHPPGQPFNGQHILDVAVATLDFGTRNFGPYPGADLKIAALPSFAHKFAGTACPDTIFLVEDRAVLLQRRDGHMEPTAHIVAHEIGHQWWGMQLNPAEAAGVTFLLETLAVYTEIAVTEQLFGPENTERYLSNTNDQYFLARNYDEEVEPPLAKATSQPYLYYHKGAHVVHVLRQLLGEEVLNRVLSQLLVDFSYPRAVVSENLVTRLLEETPEEHREAVSDLLLSVSTYDLRIEKVHGESSESGQFKTVAEITALRHGLDDRNKSFSGPLKGPLEIALLSGGRNLDVVSVAFDRKRKTVELTTAEPVDLVIVDPRGLKLEANRRDNRASLAGEP